MRLTNEQASEMITRIRDGDSVGVQAILANLEMRAQPLLRSMKIFIPRSSIAYSNIMDSVRSVMMRDILDMRMRDTQYIVYSAMVIVRCVRDYYRAEDSRNKAMMSYASLIRSSKLGTVGEFELCDHIRWVYGRLNECVARLDYRKKYYVKLKWWENEPYNKLCRRVWKRPLSSKTYLVIYRYEGMLLAELRELLENNGIREYPL